MPRATTGGPVRAGRADAVALAAASTRLAEAGIESAQLDAELLMAEAAGVPRTALILGAIAIDAEVLERFERMVARRAGREPLAYIIGRREFFSLDLIVRPGVLIPRPETETVVEAALEFLRARKRAKVFDLGTGSGAIAVAIAVHAPEARVVAADISKVSLEIALENVQRHDLSGRIVLAEGDCYGALAAQSSAFDLIVSNPPYVGQAELGRVAPEVREYEPRLALTDGADGLSFYRRIASGLERWLDPEGEVIVEIGLGQADAVETILREAGCQSIVRIRDLSGIVRVIRARGVL